MILKKFAFAVLLILPFSIAGAAQAGGKLTPATTEAKQFSAVKTSPAYAELLLRKTEREAELEEFAVDYTDEYPKVKEIKFEVNLINQAMERLLAVKAADASKLTLALGKLLVRKTELGTDLYKLHQQYTDERPEVKRLRRKIEIYEKAVKEILP